ncbi:MAG: hypothetical protein ACK50G_01825 [bacterium]
MSLRPICLFALQLQELERCNPTRRYASVVRRSWWHVGRKFDNENRTRHPAGLLQRSGRELAQAVLARPEPSAPGVQTPGLQQPGE